MPLIAAVLLMLPPDVRAADCNSNGIEDSADLAAGTSADCNATGIPDECELSRRVVYESGQLTPLVGGQPLSFDIDSPPIALGTVTLRFFAFADVSAAGEYATVNMDGLTIRRRICIRSHRLFAGPQ